MTRFTRNRGQKRLRARRRDGRFKRPALSDLGLRAPVCPHCRGFNPIGVGESTPEQCRQCGRQVERGAWL